MVCCAAAFAGPEIFIPGTPAKKLNRDSVQVVALLKTAEQYYDTEWNYTNKKKVDSAFPPLQAAIRLAMSSGITVLKHQSLVAAGRFFFRCDKVDRASRFFTAAILVDSVAGNDSLRAEAWFKFADRTPLLPPYLDVKKDRYERALQLFKKTGRIHKQVEIHQRLADMLISTGNIAEARKKLLWLLSVQQFTRAAALADTYRLLATVESSDGNYNIAISNGMQALAHGNKDIDPFTASQLNGSLGTWYQVLGENEKSLQYLRAALSCFMAGKNPDVHQRFAVYTVLRQMAHCMVLQGRKIEALYFLDSCNAMLYPETDYARQQIAGAKGDCNKALGNYAAAEDYYLTSIKLALHNDRAGNIQLEYFQLADLYTRWNKFNLAAIYISRFLVMKSDASGVSRLRDIEFMRFRADSASGNHFSAIAHFRAYKELHDSIFSAQKSKQIEELRMQYDVAQKEHSITLLKQNETLQEGRLQKAVMERRLISAGLAVILMVLIFMFLDSRKKKRINAVLSQQQQMIFTRNASLQNLINEKERLLEEKSQLIREKESLLVEVHHRVKNSLQLVNSLLYSQAVRLKDESAIRAFHDSRHRIQSLSLLHQKLYMSESLQFVNVQSYIGELILYLNDGYNKDDRVRFRIHIADVELPIQQAIPIGLILNEAVTNAVKYAFPQQPEGLIELTFSGNEQGYTLVLRDNGIGFPPGFDPLRADSFGITLIRGFCDQLEANLQIVSDNGVCITIFFNRDADKAGIEMITDINQLNEKQ
ncbi:hypothetical protein GCM10011379_16580 [Filimonas zeae]|uniref:histidine kinase n=2 Tax=Filimonas zeae TaxID=1737353 RepID=A0A917IVL5_9BACT|nr:hypothetical protein GCM10011379_16580 [Filimonas zeae]